MNNDLETIYLKIKDTYEMNKDVALVVKELHIRNGLNANRENIKYKIRINDINKQLKMIDDIFSYIIFYSSLSINKNNIDLEDIFSKTIISLNETVKDEQ